MSLPEIIECDFDHLCPHYTDLVIQKSAAIEQLKRVRECLEYFIARCENRHPDGFIRSQKTYGKHKLALTELDEFLNKAELNSK